MKYYIKIHNKGGQACVGCCDEDCLGITLKSDKFQFKISEAFFKGELVELEDIIKKLQNSTNFQIVGNSIIESLVKEGMIDKEGILVVDNIPLALVL